MWRNRVGLLAVTLATLTWTGRYLGTTRGQPARADTFLGERVSTCDFENGFVPVCPAMPCFKCQTSSGTRLVYGGAGQGWVVSGTYTCGPVVWGWCINNVCVVLGTTDATCQDLTLVTQQPVSDP